MKAFALITNSAPYQVKEIETEKPRPRDGEVLIRVVAGGITPTELQWYPTTHTKEGTERSFAIPGHEFSGVVADVGPGVVKHKVGDAVFGMNDWFEQGASAEYCVAGEQTIIAKPHTLTDPLAAALPISGLTAWQGLVSRAKAKASEHVVVVGAAGSVGLMAVQIAVARGCRVTAVASARDHVALEKLGCSSVIDYHAQKFEHVVSDVDILFDTVGSDTLERGLPTLSPGGRMVTIAADAEGKDQPPFREAFFIVEPSSSELEMLAQLFVDDKLQVFVKKTVPFEHVGKAYTDDVSDTDALGKLVFAFSEAAED